MHKYPTEQKGPSSAPTRRELEREIQRLQHELCDSRRMAELGTVACSVAHDLGNLLNNAQLVTDGTLREMQQDEHADPAPYQALRELRDVLGSMAEMVDGIVEYSRGSGNLIWESIDVSGEIEEAIQLMQEELERAHIQLHKKLSVAKLTRGTRGRVRQVVVNLLHNARDAFLDAEARNPSERWAPRTLWLESRLDDNGDVTVTLQDNAGGIPREIREQVLEPFFTTKPPGKGTGLGLAICHRTIAGLGGQLDFEVETGMGTTFSFTLPPWPS